MDGVGEWATTSAAIGRGSELDIVKEIHFPHSLGLLYSAFTYYTGFKVNSGEYKVMGLAPYGEPKYAQRISRQPDRPEGRRLVPPRPALLQLLHRPDHDEPALRRAVRRAAARSREGPAHAAPHGPRRLGAGGDRRGHAAADRGARAQQTGIENLCLAGGVALNCVANGKVLRDGTFKNIWIQPAAGDAGGALGAALAWHLFLGNARAADNRRDGMSGAYLGPSYSQAEIERRLDEAGAHFDTVSDADVIEVTAAALAAGEKAVGWFQGRMEFGPRALGARSILGDPRSPTMQKTLNLKVKYRESFRPFAPAVLREDVADWFELDADSPYMLLVADVAPSAAGP